MQTLLVTGGCGFIGSVFIRYLLTQTDFSGRIVNLDALTYAGNPENLADIQTKYPDRYCLEHADIRDPQILETIFKRHNMDAICHFAAESHVDRSIAGPEAFIQTNVMGTFNLLELVRQHQDRITRFHHVSTDEVYGSLGPAGCFTEDSPYRPNSPYSASKAASDHLVRAYGKTYDLPVVISNCSNNYGPYQFPEKLMPLVILNAMAGKPLPVYGDGQNIRDWLYVEDHCQAIWLIMQKGEIGATYNIGGGCEKTNLEVVHAICDLLDEMDPAHDGRARRELITFVTDRPGHDRRYAIDSGKLERELGWQPRESFASGLRKTIDWYRGHGKWVERVRSGEYLDWLRTHYGTADTARTNITP